MASAAITGDAVIYGKVGAYSRPIPIGERVGWGWAEVGHTSGAFIEESSDCGKAEGRRLAAQQPHGPSTRCDVSMAVGSTRLGDLRSADQGVTPAATIAVLGLNLRTPPNWRFTRT